jgi:hypothetical protein
MPSQVEQNRFSSVNSGITIKETRISDNFFYRTSGTAFQPLN